MDTNDTAPVVVGITGAGNETAALAFAAECARRDGAEVILLHAFDVPAPTRPPSIVMTYAEASDTAQRVVKEVAAEFEQLTGGAVPFQAVTVAGRAARALVARSHGARMVVVQRRHTGRLARLFVGSTVNGVAAHAECPVVSLAPEWRPQGDPGEVVVGVQEGAEPRVVLETAFAWAEADGRPLRIVHAWHLDAAYDDLVSKADAAAWREEQKEALASAAADLGELHPGVPVILEVRHQWPVDALVDDSQVASMLVVGRHGSWSWAPPRLGSLARAVLRESKSPVMVVPLRSDRDAWKDWGLDPDEISPQT